MKLKGVWHPIENAPQEVKDMADALNAERRLGRLRWEFAVGTDDIYVLHFPHSNTPKVDKYLVLPHAD